MAKKKFFCCSECGHTWEVLTDNIPEECPQCPEKELHQVKRKAKVVCTIGNVKKKIERTLREEQKNKYENEEKLNAAVDDLVENQIDKELNKTIFDFIDAGMNVARINMSHYNLKEQEDKVYLEKLIRTIWKISEEEKKKVAIMGDIQGPKVRIKKFLGDCEGQEEFTLYKKDEEFILTTNHELPRGVKGALIESEGNFDIIKNIKENIDEEEKGKPVDFWFGDGEVILEAEYCEDKKSKDKKIKIEDNKIYCKTRIAGTISTGKGVAVKNSSFEPEDYEYHVRDYEKDREDIKFLLRLKDEKKKENKYGVDFFALSFVNSGKDVDRFQQYIEDIISEKKLDDIKKRFNDAMHEFPIISKIETEDGLKNIDDIIEKSYGIMVARGDLALQTRIQDIPIFQKRIIEECVVRGKLVITATQMLSGMMDFIEPKRSEATDVANAVFDGTDALMLSGETASAKSLYPKESIEIMEKIAIAAEGYIKVRNKLEYKYKIEQLYEKIKNKLEEEKAKIEEIRKKSKRKYKKLKANLFRRGNAENISYNACKMAFELENCNAIIVLTETGGTARAISRFKPDVNILAGVYNEGIARILSASYNIKPIVIERKEEAYPFEEFEQVIEKAKNLKFLKDKDRVITVAGYPKGVAGTITFINIFMV